MRCMSISLSSVMFRHVSNLCLDTEQTDQSRREQTDVATTQALHRPSEGPFGRPSTTSVHLRATGSMGGLCVEAVACPAWHAEHCEMICGKLRSVSVRSYTARHKISVLGSSILSLI